MTYPMEDSKKHTITTKAKVTFATALIVLAGGILAVNQMDTAHKVMQLQEEVSTKPAPIQMVAAPTNMPTATPTAALKFVPKTVTVTAMPIKAVK